MIPGNKSLSLAIYLHACVPRFAYIKTFIKVLKVFVICVFVG